jgi:hypothetical protein
MLSNVHAPSSGSTPRRQVADAHVSRPRRSQSDLGGMKKPWVLRKAQEAGSAIRQVREHNERTLGVRDVDRQWGHLREDGSVHAATTVCVRWIGDSASP